MPKKPWFAPFGEVLELGILSAGFVPLESYSSFFELAPPVDESNFMNPLEGRSIRSLKPRGYVIPSNEDFTTLLYLALDTSRRGLNVSLNIAITHRQILLILARLHGAGDEPIFSLWSRNVLHLAEEAEKKPLNGPFLVQKYHSHEEQVEIAKTLVSQLHHYGMTWADYAKSKSALSEYFLENPGFSNRAIATALYLEQYEIALEKIELAFKRFEEQLFVMSKQAPELSLHEIETIVTRRWRGEKPTAKTCFVDRTFLELARAACLQRDYRSILA